MTEMGISAQRMISPERQSNKKMLTAVKVMNTMPEANSEMPWSSSSRRVSRSEVCREMIRPEVYFSWNSRLSSWVCRKTRIRRVSSMAWLTLAVQRLYQPNSSPARSPDTM